MMMMMIPMLVTLVGIVIDVNDEHSRKAWSPNSMVGLDRSITVLLLLLMVMMIMMIIPILVTLVETVTDVRAEQD